MNPKANIMQHDNASIVNVNSFFTSIETAPEAQKKTKIIDAITKKLAIEEMARGDISN